MKKELWIIPFVFVMMASCAGYPSGGGYYGGPEAQSYPPGSQQYPTNPQMYGPNEDSSYFYDRLSPYGDWVDLNPYGYVWTPRHMGYRWRPYTEGHWVWTDYGWTWIADQDWGDIPFHYGRWGWDDEIGWFWVPGTVWGPAWVTWRSNDQYFGWAPLPPGVGFSIGMNLNSLSMDIPFNFWVFIQGSHFQDRDLYPYVLPFERNRTIVNYTVIHNNIYTRNNRIINEGIGMDEVRRITRRDVPRYALQDVRQPGRARIVGRDVQMFRPTVRQNDAARPKVLLNRDQARQDLAPAKVFEPRGQRAVDKEASAALKRQNEEARLLKDSQAQELKSLQLRHAQEAQGLRDAKEKAKIQSDYQAKVAELKKSHVVEQQQLTARHKNDTEQVKKIAQTRKVRKAQAPKATKKNKNN